MKISIIVPVYNKSKFINKLYLSIVNQTYKDYEIIFINDGSTDNSIDILRKLEEKDERIKVFNQKNMGPGNARKQGFIKSTGDLLYFIDADDYLPNDDILLKIINIFVKYDPDILLFDREDLFDDFSCKIEFFDRLNKKVKSGFYNINNFPDVFIHPGLGCKIFKKSILNESMFINYRNFEDSYTSYIYLDKCNNYYYQNECFYTIYEKKDNVSLTKSAVFKEARFEIEKMDVLIKLYNKIKKRSLKNSILDLYPETILSIFIYLKRNHINQKEKKDFKKYLKKLIRISKKEKLKYSCQKQRHYVLKKMIYNFLILIY